MARHHSTRSFFRFIYFQWLTIIENGNAVPHRGGCRLLRYPPIGESARIWAISPPPWIKPVISIAKYSGGKHGWHGL